MSVDIRQGDARGVLATLPAASVHCVITSPPYFCLRNYNGGAQEIGAESTPAAYVAHLVEVFRAVQRVLRPDGTCWVVIGDSFASSGVAGRVSARSGLNHGCGAGDGQKSAHAFGRAPTPEGVPAKNLLLIPHRVALALQADGWYVRNDCVWAKGSAMPESVQDRFSRAHEYVFHLAKSERYYFDPVAVAEPVAGGRRRAYPSWAERKADGAAPRRGDPGQSGDVCHWDGIGGNGQTRNRRSVLHINPQPFSAAGFGVKDIDHYAVFPEKLVEILTLCSTSEAGCCPRCAAPWRRVVERGRTFESGSGRRGVMPTGKNGAGMQGGGATLDVRRGPVVHTTTTGWEPGCSCDAGPPLACTTLDPFLGSGTVALVSKRLGRSCVGIELNPAYCELAQRRVESTPYTLFSAASTSTGAAR